MNQKKISSKVYSIAKSALSAAILPVFLIYIMMDKPDYKIMNGLSKIVLPVAEWVGNGITWPIHAIGDATSSIRELSNLRTENEELKAKLSEAIRQKNEYDIAISENQRLTRELDIIRKTPQKSIVANITFNNNAFSHSTFFINKGINNGIEKDMAVVSFEGALVGIISDVGVSFAKVRGLTDSKSNIPVRIAGSEVYGFLQGNGSDKPTMGFFSDPEFQPTPGLKLITSGIRGVLPDGINVGEMSDNKDTKIILPSSISSVMVLKFDGKDKYK
ncbi:MAG: rod shape-determining protein MreC [Alphaproteobacteria bacterium]|nr:rod shape-determining protein MreC [Alphaproteobacteria bacterium]MBN2675352.1 rod shape-determining protein MreC [Alphaproteobacteria bacterium]